MSLRLCSVPMADFKGFLSDAPRERIQQSEKELEIIDGHIIRMPGGKKASSN